MCIHLIYSQTPLSNVTEIALKGVTNSPMNADSLKYISDLLSNYTPMIIVSTYL